MGKESRIGDSESEGMVLHPEYLKEDLHGFLQGIVDTFYEYPSVWDLPESLAIMYSHMDVAAQKKTLDVAKKHFSNAMFPDEDHLDFDLNQGNVLSFLMLYRQKSLEGLLEQYLTPRKWKKMQKTMKDRYQKWEKEYVFEEKYFFGTPG